MPRNGWLRARAWPRRARNAAWVWAITKLVMLSGNSAPDSALKAWIWRLVRDAGSLRARSLYPGRSPLTWNSPAAGLCWVAATLEHLMDKREAVCNDWPEVSDPWFRHAAHGPA